MKSSNFDLFYVSKIPDVGALQIHIIMRIASRMESGKSREEENNCINLLIHSRFLS